MRLAERYLPWIIFILLKYVHLAKATFRVDRCAVDRVCVCECVCVCLCGSNKGLVASRLLLAGHWELTVWMWGDYVFTAGPVFTSAERMQRGGFGFGLVNLPARGLYLETVWVSLCVSVCVCMCGVCVCVRVCVWLSAVSTSTLLTDHPHHSAYWLCELIFGSIFSILMYPVT